MAELVGIPGLRIFINGIRRDGHSLTNQYVGRVYGSKQDDGGENIFLQKSVWKARRRRSFTDR